MDLTQYPNGITRSDCEGRSVSSVLLIIFVDGSKTVTIAECNSPPLQEGARIRQISQDQTKLLFECEDDSTLDVTIVDPGNSVIVRNKNNQVEYLG
jgi:hypothetical protein